MPLSDDATLLQGGCRCKAIRYKLELPKLQDRDYFPGGSDQVNVRTPVALACHCDDCRSATGSAMPFYLCTSRSTLSAAFVPPSDKVPAHGALDVDSPLRGLWLPADQAFDPLVKESDTFLTHFASSDFARRCFCRRCGTAIGYQIYPFPEEVPKEWSMVIEIVLGTLDRESFEQVEVQAQLWYNSGVPWLQDIMAKGLHAGRLESFMLTEEVKA